MTHSTATGRSFSYDAFTARELFERHRHLATICAELPNPHGFDEDPVCDALFTEMDTLRDAFASRSLDTVDDWRVLCALMFTDQLEAGSHLEISGLHAGLFERMREELAATDYATAQTTIDNSLTYISEMAADFPESDYAAPEVLV